MAQIEIEEIVGYLDCEIRGALKETVNEVIGNVTVDEYELFHTFIRAIRRKCSTWESVPSHYIGG